ncbi:MAG: SIR2 family protein, partial [Candidatus Acidiferrales bacterium]
REDEVYRYCDPAVDAKGRKIIPTGEYLRLAQKFELTREVTNKGRRESGRVEIRGIHEQVSAILEAAYDRHRVVESVEHLNLLRAKSLPLPTWVTTNYDTFIEDTVLREALETRSAAILKRPIKNFDFALSAGASQTLFKIHGCIENDPQTSIVITEEDYYRFLREDKYITNKLYTLFCERTVVFLGYSLSDPNIQFIYHEVLFDQKRFKADGEFESFSTFRPAFFVTERPVPDHEKTYFRHKRINYVEGYSIEQFFEELIAVFEEQKVRQSGITEIIRSNFDEYQEIYKRSQSQAPAEAVQVAAEDRPDYVRKLLDLIELREAVYVPANTTASAISEFDKGGMLIVEHRAIDLIQTWCSEDLGARRTDMLEVVFTFLERKLSTYRSYALKRLLDSVRNWIMQFRDVGDMEHFARRYCRMLIQYDRDYNDWEDYPYCLDHYVRASRLMPLLTPALQRDMIQGLYNQLEMCGRETGDSWYTTNHIYDVWDQFDANAWPQLEDEIRRNHQGYKQKAMLEWLKPGQDFRSFLPRE